jgi:amino acid permease
LTGSLRLAAARTLARSALLVLWALVLWGTLLIAAAALEVPTDGAATVAARVLPGRGASLWAWLNALAMMLAVFVWAAVATRLARGRRPS